MNDCRNNNGAEGFPVNRQSVKCKKPLAMGEVGIEESQFAWLEGKSLFRE